MDGNNVVSCQFCNNDIIPLNMEDEYWLSHDFCRNRQIEIVNNFDSFIGKLESNSDSGFVAISRYLLTDYNFSTINTIGRFEIYNQSTICKVNGSLITQNFIFIAYSITTTNYIVSILTQIDLDKNILGSSFIIIPKNEIDSYELEVSNFNTTIKNYYSDMSWSINQLASVYAKFSGYEKGLQIIYSNLANEVNSFITLFTNFAPSYLLDQVISTTISSIKDGCVHCVWFLCVDMCSVICAFLSALAGGTCYAVAVGTTIYIPLVGEVGLGPYAAILCAGVAAGICVPTCYNSGVCNI